MTTPMGDSVASPACRDARHRLIDNAGLTLHALEWGRPAATGLCFLHGSSAHAHWFDLVVSRFADDFHVMALDQRGHGASGWSPAAAYSTSDFVEDLAKVLDAVGWEKVVLIGHSFGGHNAMCFGARYPDRVSALVLAECRPGVPSARVAQMRRLAARPSRQYPTEAAAIEAFRLFPPGTMASAELLTHLARAGVREAEGGWSYRVDPACNGTRTPTDAWPLLERITAPTLIVRGGRAGLEPRATFCAMRDAIPTAELVDIEDAYHHVTLDAPHRFAAIVHAWLGVRAGGALQSGETTHRGESCIPGGR
jgi:pimeloyl-ACP methyl ester carboxylesterase